MNPELIKQVSDQLGANGLPYTIPIHPNLVHITLGLFIIAIAFDIAGVLFPLEKSILKFLSIDAVRSNFFDVGWYNVVAAAVITFFTVAAGFYEIMLATPLADVKSAWGLGAMDTMIWHGVGGVLLLALIVGMAVWRGFQRFVWRKDNARQVQWSYVAAGVFILGIMFAQGTLGAHLGGEFGVHNTADNLLQAGSDPNIVLK
ncbi:MAG: DUF2231 domain-containing protein [Verrucomicrobia bacterium]|nr:DUF2231 domain-containing protein [Leptolyngbya sp. ES-bin-22]